MQGRVIVCILLIEHFFQEKLSLGFEVAHDLIVVSWRDQLFELVEDHDASPGVVRVLSILEVLDLHEEIEELIKAFNDIDVNLQKRFERLVAFSELVHRSIVNWVPSQRAILLSQDLTVASDNIAGVLFEE